MFLRKPAIRVPRYLVPWLAALFGILGASGEALGATYTYTSLPYNDFIGSTYSPANFLSVSVTFTDVLSPNMPVTDMSGSVVDWSLYDQQDLLTPANSVLASAQFTTDSTGQITGWGFGAGTPEFNLVLATVNLPGFTVHDGSSFGADSGQRYDAPQTWQLVATPEPASSSYVLAGFASLVACKRLARAVVRKT